MYDIWHDVYCSFVNVSPTKRATDIARREYLQLCRKGAAILSPIHGRNACARDHTLGEADGNIYTRPTFMHEQVKAHEANASQDVLRVACILKDASTSKHRFLTLHVPFDTQVQNKLLHACL